MAEVDLKDLDDETLIKRCQAAPKSGKNTPEFAELCRRIAAYIDSYARRHARNLDPETLQDMEVEILVKIWEVLPRYVQIGEGRFKYYVQTIFRNKYLEYLKGEKRRERFAVVESLDADHDEEGERMVPLGDVLSDGSGDPFQILSQSLSRDQVWQGLVVLKPQYQAVLLMHLEGFSGAEIASALGLKAGTVYVMLKRAIDQLRAKIERGETNPFFSIDLTENGKQR